MTNRLDDVFGITREEPMNYVERETVDGRFIDNLARDRHIVVYGSSKQGKTSLRKHCLKPEDYITVTCSNQWSASDVNAAILKAAGYELIQSETVATSGENRVEAKLSIGLGGSGVEVGAGSQEGDSGELVYQPMELDVGDVNDIIATLAEIEFSRYIVLEDFHYLPVETQRDFAVSLKAFHENSDISFVIIGVWLDPNRLSVYNGDLTGRIVPVGADEWTEGELRQVVTIGGDLMNVDFSEEFVNGVIQHSRGSVWVVQEACNRACRHASVVETASKRVAVGDKLDAGDIISEIVDEQGGRYQSFLIQFAAGFQSTELEMFKWLLYPVVTSTQEDLDRGFSLRDITATLRARHERGDNLNQGNITQALQSVADLQAKKNVKPLILDYDTTNLTLNVVDRAFSIWLLHQDRNELLEMLDLPTGD